MAGFQAPLVAGFGRSMTSLSAGPKEHSGEDRDCRAIAFASLPNGVEDTRRRVGMSMGDGQALQTGLSNLDKSAFIGGFSSHVQV